MNSSRIFAGEICNIIPQPGTHQVANSATRLCRIVQDKTVGSPFCECKSTLVFCPIVTYSHCLQLGFASKWKTCVS